MVWVACGWRSIGAARGRSWGAGTVQFALNLGFGSAAGQWDVTG